MKTDLACQHSFLAHSAAWNENQVHQAIALLMCYPPLTNFFFSHEASAVNQGGMEESGGTPHFPTTHY